MQPCILHQVDHWYIAHNLLSTSWPKADCQLATWTRGMPVLIYVLDQYLVDTSVGQFGICMLTRLH